MDQQIWISSMTNDARSSNHYHSLALTQPVESPGFPGNDYMGICSAEALTESTRELREFNFQPHINTTLPTTSTDRSAVSNSSDHRSAVSNNDDHSKARPHDGSSFSWSNDHRKLPLGAPIHPGTISSVINEHRSADHRHHLRTSQPQPVDSPGFPDTHAPTSVLSERAWTSLQN
ncbi:uncharacterized protein LOC129750511 [Uranotaenia lowii]|uniref:uncharacterized protein LOC129750511 n=1 Tax=Uranotaenia lowii TaxID=190385 RepID=UPI002479A865|nr:uncharacterized protein LOC129750511 [Uranotaenia lowii]